MNISTIKTKTMTVCKEILRCELEIQGEVKEAMSFKYLEVEITSNGPLQSEVKHQA
jgi:hypothetical protein